MNSLSVGQNGCDPAIAAGRYNDRKWTAIQIAIGTTLVGVVAGIAITVLGILFAAWAMYVGMAIFAGLDIVALGAGGVSIYYDCKANSVLDKK